MNEIVKIIFGLIGGLAMFLFGMNAMSDALQKAAGERMRQVLSALTRNPVMGVLAGALVTAVLQSSSATTVMVIGFVSADLMGLPQAISVIFGANIGTTMTAQLLAFRLSDYIYPILFIGFLLNFAAKDPKVKNVGMVLFSFGLLFEGIEIMGSVMKPLASSPVFTGLMARVTDIPVLGVLLGMVMTLVVQSSSATIAVLQNFAQQAGPDGVTSIMGLAGAIPILLGDNIGTTITALLASIGQSKNAKRTAVAHSVFNITGSIVMLFLIPWFAQFITFISPKGAEVEVISRQIANAHTAFNLLNTLVWLPLLPLMVKIVKAIIPGEDAPLTLSDSQPRFLNRDVLNQPVAALYLAAQEIARCAGEVREMLTRTDRIFQEPDRAPAEEDSLRVMGAAVEDLHDKIADYISALFAGGGLTEDQAEETAGLMVVSDQIARIAQRCVEVLDCACKDGRALSLSDVAQEELHRCFTTAQDLFDRAVRAVREGDPRLAEAILRDKELLKKAERALSKRHLERVKAQTCDPSLTVAFSNILYALDRIGDSCGAVAEEVLDGTSLPVLPAET